MPAAGDGEALPGMPAAAPPAGPVVTSVENLASQLEELINDYMRTQDPAVLFVAGTETLAAELWRAAQPADMDQPTEHEAWQLSVARRCLGWYYFRRYRTVPTRQMRRWTVEQAQAIAMLAPIAHLPDMVPVRLKTLVGPEAIAHQQAITGTVVMDYALTTHRGTPHLLDAAIYVLTSATGNAPHHRHQAERLSLLALAYLQRYAREGRAFDIDRAVSAAERAAAASGPGRRQPRELFVLGRAYSDRFRRDGDAADVDAAIELWTQAIALLRTRDPVRVLIVSYLGGAYLERFAFTGARPDLDQAMDYAETAVTAASARHPEAASMVSGLGMCYRARFLRTGAAADLDMAVALCEAAVGGRADDTATEPVLAVSLGAAYQNRFELTGAATDLDRIIELIEPALVAVPSGHPYRPAMLSQLAKAYTARGRLNWADTDLDRAVALGGAAVSACPPASPQFRRLLLSLSAAYEARLDRLGANATTADCDRVVQLAERAVDAAVDGQRGHAAMVGNLASLYRWRFTRRGEIADLERAIELATEAEAATPGDDPDKLAHVTTLGWAYLDRIEAAGQAVSEQVLHQLAEQVSGETAATVMNRVSASHAVGALAAAMGDRQTARRLLDSAVRLLPSVATGAVWADQGDRLGAHGDLVSAAIAAHCALGDTASAVEAAELGTGVLLTRQLGLRGDVSAPHADVSLVPEGGAAVLINAGDRSGDAIVIASGAQLIHVSLPELTDAAVRTQVDRLHRATYNDGTTAGAGERLAELLAWLWESAVGPVVAALPPGTGSPAQRVWWMPSGLLARLPLHAAGIPGHPGALDRLVSSYTVTLRTLAHSRARPAADARRQLAVVLEETPGLTPLPGAGGEVLGLPTGAPAGLALSGATATAERVLAELPRMTWVHFACHATADIRVPARGGLHLADGILPMSAIGGLQVSSGELAYLSACSTADRGRVMNESLTLVSAFQLAGFRHVIGNLWPLNDYVAATAARAFYRRLPDGPTADEAAATLRGVTLALRARYPDRPDAWAALTHSGP